MDEKQINKILSVLQSQSFQDWYNGPFEKFVTGDMEIDTGKSYIQCIDLIKKDIKAMFN